MLKNVLDVYGADRTRWPAASRREISALLTVSEEARRLVADAEAFDRLLDTAPPPGATRIAALSDRILAASRQTPRVVSTASPPRLRAAPIVRRYAGGLAALAASLMIGILAGQSTSVQPAVTALATLAGLDEAALTNVSRADETEATFDGELL